MNTLIWGIRIKQKFIGTQKNKIFDPLLICFLIPHPSFGTFIFLPLQWCYPTDDLKKLIRQAPVETCPSTAETQVKGPRVTIWRWVTNNNIKLISMIDGRTSNVIYLHLLRFIQLGLGRAYLTELFELFTFCYACNPPKISQI